MERGAVISTILLFIVPCLIGCQAPIPVGTPVEATNVDIGKEYHVYDYPGKSIISTTFAPHICHFKYDFGNEKADVNVLVGPWSQVTFKEDESYFELNSGWVYLWGRYPRVKRGRIHAGAEGSGMALVATTESGKKVDRLYFLYGDRISYSITDGGSGSWPDSGYHMRFVNETEDSEPEFPGDPISINQIAKIRELILGLGLGEIPLKSKKH